MADSLFGFDTTLPDEFLDNGPAEPSEEFEDEYEYDALNDETFGASAAEGDWEEDHEQFSKLTEELRHRGSLTNEEPLIDLTEGEAEDGESTGFDLEHEIENLILTDDKERQLHNVERKKEPKIFTLEELERDLLAQSPGKIKFPSGNDGSPSERVPIPRMVPLNYETSRSYPPFPLYQNNPVASSRTPTTVNMGLQCHPVIPIMRPTLFPFNRHVGDLPPGFIGPPPPDMIRFLPPRAMMGFSQGQSPPHNGFRLRIPQIPPQGFPMEPPNILHPRASNMPLSPASDQHYNFHPSNNKEPLLNGFNSIRYERSRGRVREVDPFRGFMTPREKNWVDNIQYMQLYTSRPFVDDYYYTVMVTRRAESEGRVNDMQDRREREPQGSTAKVYSPTQFQNSLGKLQVGSVVAPRKVIDVDIVPVENDNSDASSPIDDAMLPNNNTSKTDVSKSRHSNRKFRQTLLEIERLYTLLLQLEDVVSPVAELRESVTESRNVLLSRILTSLLSEDWLVNMLCFNKGKRLVHRLLKLVSPKESEQLLCELWIRMLTGLPTVYKYTKSEGSEDLVNFYVPFKFWLFNAPFSSVLKLTSGLLANNSNKENVLSFLLSNKFGISSLASAVCRADELISNAGVSEVSEWCKFLQTLISTVENLPPSELLSSPVDPVDDVVLNNQLDKCFGNVETNKFIVLEKAFSFRSTL